MERAVPEGKHLRVGGAPYRVKGVTYGSFSPRSDGWHFPEKANLERDLVAMAECGFTTVRTYDVPPPDMLDGARALGLRVLVGLSYPTGGCTRRRRGATAAGCARRPVPR